MKYVLEAPGHRECGAIGESSSTLPADLRTFAILAAFSADRANLENAGDHQ